MQDEANWRAACMYSAHQVSSGFSGLNKWRQTVASSNGTLLGVGGIFLNISSYNAGF